MLRAVGRAFWTLLVVCWAWAAAYAGWLFLARRVAGAVGVPDFLTE